MRLLGILVLFLCSQSWASLDQRNLPEHLDQIANPTRLELDYASINKQHKILVAMIDSGIDYTHPDLVKHLHFDLDENDLPVGLGHDYAGNDSWPYPFLVQSGISVFEDLYTQLVKKALRTHPEMQEKISIHRAFNAEHEADVGHGTHVAGIIADQEKSSIGIVPFKTGPIFDWPEARGKDINDNHFAAFLDAHKRAYEKGVRIINVSMVFADQGTGHERIRKILIYAKQYEDFLRAHPDLLVVAAAGNNGESLQSSETKKQFPCGMRLPNILCVGHTDSNGNLSPRSNRYPGYKQIVFANGTDVLSTYPLGYCNPLMDLASIVESIDPLSRNILNSVEADIFTRVMRDGCKGLYSHVTMSGSSMAAPYVTRMAAKIKMAKPDATVEEIIYVIRQQARNSENGLYDFNRLPL